MSRFKSKPGAVDFQSLALGDLIASVGRGVARAQRNLDESSLLRLTEYHEFTAAHKNDLRATWPSPAWYSISETTAEIKFVLTADLETTYQRVITKNLGAQKRTPLELRAIAIDGVVARKYSFSMETWAELKFEIKPIPAVEVFQEG
jgi:hypothetical protein